MSKNIHSLRAAWRTATRNAENRAADASRWLNKAAALANQIDSDRRDHDRWRHLEDMVRHLAFTGFLPPEAFVGHDTMSDFAVRCRDGKTVDLIRLALDIRRKPERYRTLIHARFGERFACYELSEAMMRYGDPTCIAREVAPQIARLLVEHLQQAMRT